MKQYETFELRFGGEVLPDAWAQIDLTATFSCAQESLTVKGFYDGESDGRGAYVVRFLPQYAGVYRYQVRGAVTAEGEIVCEASSTEAHGIVRAVVTHFVFHGDGGICLPHIHPQIGIALGVLQQNIVLGHMPLDQAAFQHQSLKL